LRVEANERLEQGKPGKMAPAKRTEEEQKKLPNQAQHSTTEHKRERLPLDLLESGKLPVASD
jgi:hypothetical protein